MKKSLCLLIIVILFVGSIPAHALDLGKIKDAVKIGQGVAKASRPMTAEEEHYVGRAVAARLLSTYALLENKKLTDYINTIGQVLAAHSDMPFTFGGYHFAILNSEELNAFACPGGIVLVTKGIINATKSEDELATVLAHEIAHIAHRHGVSAISKSRWTEVATTIGTETTKDYSPQVVSKLVGLFEGAIDDVFKTLVVNGYGKSQEFQADESGMIYLAKAGYNPGALKDLLDRLVSQGASSGGGIMKTHPATKDRIKNVQQKMPSGKVDPALVQLRSQRFQVALK
jgi:predicted Zn-dependent protease